MAKTLAHFIDNIRDMKEQITKNAERFATAAPNKRRESNITGRLKVLEANYNDAMLWHTRVIGMKEEGNLREKYFADKVFINLKEQFLDYQAELNDALLEEHKGAANTSIATDKAVDIRLRRIEIPPFSGGYEQWRPFYELYVALVHNNESLADIQKLHYLKASVQGEAARLLQHVSLEDKNYASAWTILTDRYENKRVLVNTHLKLLLNQENLVTETAAGMKEILDTTTECLHSLRNLGVPVDTWDTILIHTLCAKLPSSTQELWESQLQGGKNLVEFTTFSKFLETRFRTLESIEHSKAESRRTSIPTKSFIKPTKAFYTNISASNGSQHQSTCPLCKEDHNLWRCEKFIKIHIKMRNETSRNLKVCTNCLSTKHTLQQCTSRFRCQKCKQKHHTLLHSTPAQFEQYRQHNDSNARTQTNYSSINAKHLLLNQPQQENTQNHQQNYAQCSQINTRQAQNNTFTVPLNLLSESSNAEEVLQGLPKEDREINTPMTFGSEDYVKTLGLQWYPGPDVFKFNFNLPASTVISKRNILSDISRLFDPHGWISPCIVYAKLIMQELWLQQADWDNPVPESLKTQWLKYRNELHTLENLEIPRWIRTYSTSKFIQIHGFCYASEKAYAAAVYIRIKEKNEIHVQLLTAKTKIAPIQRISLPRLELCAAVLLAKLLESAKQLMEFEQAETFAWTDSMITLAWIKANPSKWKSFLANRVSEIQSRTSTSIWHHINTKENPADIASLGLFPSKMEDATMWWYGPPMLKTFTSPKTSNAGQFSTALEIRKKTTRIIAYCLRAIYNFKKRKKGNIQFPNCTGTRKGTLLAIKTTQTTTFNAEKLNLINKVNLSNRSALDRWSYIQQLYQNFWDKWSIEYLTRFQQRPKWNVQQPNIQIGNLVIIKDGRIPQRIGS